MPGLRTSPYTDLPAPRSGKGVRQHEHPLPRLPPLREADCTAPLPNGTHQSGTKEDTRCQPLRSRTHGDSSLVESPILRQSLWTQRTHQYPAPWVVGSDSWWTTARATEGGTRWRLGMAVSANQRQISAAP